MKRGYTIVELATVLLLMALASSTLLPLGRHLQDRSAVVSAREAVAGLVAEARIASRMHGGSVVHVESGPWRAWYTAGGAVGREVALGEELEVEVGLRRSRSSLAIRFNALGLGEVASNTIAFRRGAAESGLTLSSYGRVRRW